MNPHPLPLTELGTIPANRQRTFYRVETWQGQFVADFPTRAQAERFAITDARAKGCRYDHKASTVNLTTP